MMSQQFSIAAIVPLYNGAKFIEQALRSIARQTLPPDEIIVVDDGSTDESASVVRRLAETLPIRLLSKANGGQSSARNLGVASCKSSLVAFLDQDDLWHANHLEELVKPFREERGIQLGWVYSNLDELDERGRLMTRCFLSSFRTEHPKRKVTSCLGQDMLILPSASLVSRRAFEAVGGFDERLCGYEDDDLFLRLFCAGYDNVYIDKPLSSWRIYPTSTSWSVRMRKSRRIYMQQLLRDFPNEPDRRRYLSRDFIAPRFLRHILSDCYRAAQKRDGAGLRDAIEEFWIILPHLGRNALTCTLRTVVRSLFRPKKSVSAQPAADLAAPIQTYALVQRARM